MVKNGILYKANEVTQLTSDHAANVGLRTLNITAIGHEMLFDGDTIFVLTRGGDAVEFEVDGDVSATATTISVVSKATEGVMLKGSIIYLSDKEITRKANKKYMTMHLHIFQSTGTNGKDFISGANQPYNFNVNTNAVLADGDSKPNQWATKHAFYVAHKATRIERVTGHAACNKNNEDLTLNLWHKTVNLENANNTNINLAYTKTVSSGASPNNVKDLSGTSVGVTIPAGSVLIPSIKRGGALASAQWWADIDILLSFDIDDK